MCNFGRKHQRYRAAMQYKIREDYLGSEVGNRYFSSSVAPAIC